MKPFWVIGLTLLSACYLGHGSYNSMPRIGDKNTYLITEIWDRHTMEKLKKSGWYRTKYRF